MSRPSPACPRTRPFSGRCDDRGEGVHGPPAHRRRETGRPWRPGHRKPDPHLRARGERRPRPAAERAGQADRARHRRLPAAPRGAERSGAGSPLGAAPARGRGGRGHRRAGDLRPAEGCGARPPSRRPAAAGHDRAGVRLPAGPAGRRLGGGHRPRRHNQWAVPARLAVRAADRAGLQRQPGVRREHRAGRRADRAGAGPGQRAGQLRDRRGAAAPGLGALARRRPAATRPGTHDPARRQPPLRTHRARADATQRPQKAPGPDRRHRRPDRTRAAERVPASRRVPDDAGGDRRRPPKARGDRPRPPRRQPDGLPGLLRRTGELRSTAGAAVLPEVEPVRGRVRGVLRRPDVLAGRAVDAVRDAGSGPDRGRPELDDGTHPPRRGRVRLGRRASAPVVRRAARTGPACRPRRAPRPGARTGLPRRCRD
jgi:hypothetical protein